MIRYISRSRHAHKCGTLALAKRRFLEAKNVSNCSKGYLIIGGLGKSSSGDTTIAFRVGKGWSSNTYTMLITPSPRISPLASTTMGVSSFCR